MNRSIVLATMLLTLAACDKKETPAAADSSQPSAAPPQVTATPSAAPAATVVVDVSTLPVEEDFEADAEKELTAANLSAKLDDLDKEISAP